MIARRSFLAVAGGAALTGAIGKGAAEQEPTAADFLAACRAHPERVMPAFKHIWRMRDGMGKADSFALYLAELEALA